MKPEGIVAFHVQTNTGFKVTLERDEEHKAETARRSGLRDEGQVKGA